MLIFVYYLLNISQFFFTVVPCILVSIKFIHQQMHSLLNLTKFSNFALKIPLTCFYVFRSTTIIREPSLEPS